MATITVTTPRPASPFDPDDLIIDLHDNEPWKRDIEGLLLKLGQKLIEHDLDNGWLSLSQVSAFCRRYRLHWQRGSTKAKDLRYPVKDLFRTAGDIRGNGVKVEARAERNERTRGQELFLDFRRTCPDGTCA